MSRVLRWYGAGTLHLLALIGCFALAGYAALRLLADNPVGVAVWFLGAVIAHDLVLLPLYALADRSVLSVLRHRQPPAARTTTSVNFVRVPALLSGLLLLVWFPLILRLPDGFTRITGLTTAPYLERWLLVTGVLFAISAVAFAVSLRRRRPAH